MNNFVSAGGTGKHTQNAATRIRVAIGGTVGRLFTHVTNLRYSDTGTAHTLTLMTGATRSTIVGPHAAGVTAITMREALFDGAGNVMAASDVIAIQLDNGEWHVDIVSAVTGTALTLTTAIPTGRSVLDNAKVVCYGVAGDAMHAHQQYIAGAATGAINVPAVAGTAPSLCKSSGTNEPIIFDSNNATNAGTLDYANFIATPV